MSIRYKFKSENIFSQILFDGIYISVADIKKEIYKQRKLGRSENVDLMISNASNNEKYIEDDCLVPKNTSVIVMRVPSANPSGKTKKFIKNYSQEVPQAAPINTTKTFAPVSTNLLTMKGTEEDKIFAMMMQSTLDYQTYQIQPQNNNFSVPPSTYICRKCHIPGHFIRNCTLVLKQTYRYDPKAPRKESKKMTGIPMSMRNKTESNQQVYSKEVESFQITKNLFCSICKDIFRNPVTMPCCKTIYCNECAVIKLLESDDSNCPKCDEKFIFPGMLDDDNEMKKIVEKSQKANGSSFIKYNNASTRSVA
ncbi:unnamed protein product [Chironomus riparius]|uniref:Uncharacterized protein n=1 Tax=Chironomus riparius TaxID=315576 RepID=A0A9N9SB32_9DIPT|nr:unnamed protein product [Chironomus riparius]